VHGWYFVHVTHCCELTQISMLNIMEVCTHHDHIYVLQSKSNVALNGMTNLSSIATKYLPHQLRY